LSGALAAGGWGCTGAGAGGALGAAGEAGVDAGG